MNCEVDCYTRHLTGKIVHQWKRESGQYLNRRTNKFLPVQNCCFYPAFMTENKNGKSVLHLEVDEFNVDVPSSCTHFG